MLTKQRATRKTKPDRPAASPAAKKKISAWLQESPPARPGMDAEVRRQMVARAAYLRAGRRGFQRCA